MTFGGFQSTWGKVYKYFSLKLWFLIAMAIFEVGSLLCALAKGPTTLIVGRAIAGLGGSGVAVGVFGKFWGRHTMNRRYLLTLSQYVSPLPSDSRKVTKDSWQEFFHYKLLSQPC
jgi:MFS family permease